MSGWALEVRDEGADYVVLSAYIVNVFASRRYLVTVDEAGALVINERAWDDVAKRWD